MKLKHDELLSNFACFAFNCKLRHYDKGGVEGTAAECLGSSSLIPVDAFKVGRCRFKLKATFESS